MSIATDLSQTVTYGEVDQQATASFKKCDIDSLISSQNITNQDIARQDITRQDFEFYTTKNGSAWFQQDDKDLNKCIAHETIEEAIRYAGSHLCTIICVKGKSVIWSGGPYKAKLLDFKQL